MNLKVFAGFLVAACGCHSANATTPPTDAPAAAAAQKAPAPKAPVTHVGTNPGRAGDGSPLVPTGRDKLAAFAAGCFWGVEDAFRHVPGVVSTAVGYAGGHTASPSYEEVCTHTTGHAETVLVEYDPTHIPYEQLLRVFWKMSATATAASFSRLTTSSRPQRAHPSRRSKSTSTTRSRPRCDRWGRFTRPRATTSSTPSARATTVARSAFRSTRSRLHLVSALRALGLSHSSIRWFPKYVHQVTILVACILLRRARLARSRTPRAPHTVHGGNAQ
jgi:methionine-S-sulfoxide reductase